MQPLILPGGLGRNKGLWRPPGLPSINWDDPRADGLILCTLPDGKGWPVDLTGNWGPFSASRTSPPFQTVPTAAGMGLGFSKALGQGLGAIGPGFPIDSGSFAATWLIVAVLNPLTSGSGGILLGFGVQGAATNIMSLNTTTTNKLNIVANGSTFTGPSFTPNVPLAIAVTTAGTSIFQAPLGGARTKNSVGRSTTSTVANTASLGSSYRNGGFSTAALDGVILLAAAWPRTLPDSEIWDMLADPFGFLFFRGDEVGQQYAPIRGNVYSVSISETATALDSIGTSLRISVTISEIGSAADILSSKASLHGAISESGTAADTTSSKATLTGAIGESGSGADAVSSKATLTGAVSESGSASEALSSKATLQAGVAETAAATDTVSSRATLLGAIAEVGAAIETISASVVVLAIRRMALFFRGLRGN